MGQGGTLSWRRGSLYPGWLQECPCWHRVSILHASGPPAPPTPTEGLQPRCIAGRWTSEESPALHCVLLWPLLLGFLQTLTLVWSHTGKRVTECRLQPAFWGQIPSKPSNTQGG